MDPLSATASGVAFITAALQVIKVLYDDFKNIRDAPQTIKDAMSDLVALQSMLMELEKAAQDDKDHSARYKKIEIPIENCSQVCKAFKAQLEKWTKPDGDGMRAISRFQIGLFEQKSIKEFKSKLGDCKSTLTVTLVAENFIQSPLNYDVSPLIERSQEILEAHLSGIDTKLQRLQVDGAKDDEVRDKNHQDMQNTLRDQFASLSALLLDLKSLSETLPAKEQVEKMRDYLLFTLPSQDRDGLVKTMGQPVEGTCEWILDNEQFKGWLSAEPAFLWLRGDTGKGKSMLSIALSGGLLEDRVRRVSPDAHIIYYFCGRQDIKRNTAAGVLRSLLFQLMSKPDLTDAIARHLAERPERPLQSDYESLWKLFAALMEDLDCGKVYCILDGLDELADDKETIWLVNKLLSLFAPGAKQPQLNVLRLLLLSRDIKDFTLRGQSQMLDLDESCTGEINTDIGKVVDTKLAAVPDWLKLEDDYKIQVKEEVLRKADGSFVPIGIIMNAILVDRPASGLLETIRSLPRGLEALYGNTLLSLKSKDQYKSPEILQWVAMAYRPLSLKELADAIGNNLNEVAIRATVQRCGSVLTIDDEIVNLSHTSMRDYLLRTDSGQATTLENFDAEQRKGVEQFLIDPQEAHLEIAMRCLELIKDSHLQHRAMDSKDEWEGSALLEYAVIYWPLHARGSGPLGKKIFQSTSFILSSEASLRQNWWSTYVHQRPGRNWEQWEQGEQLSPLHIACRFGILEWAKTLLGEFSQSKVKKVIDETDINGMTPLAWAITGGHEHVVSLLLDYGAKIEERTALYSREGAGALHSRAVKSYLRDATKGDGMWTGYHTPLYRAAYKSHASVVKLLIERGASVNELGWRWCSPLHAVAIGGNVEVLRLLLRQGVKDIDATTSGSYTTPLHYAVENGHRDIAELLLEHGADIKKRQRYSLATVLHFAGVKTPNPATVELLLDKGAEVNARDSHGRKALHCFVMRHPEPEAVKLLLDRGTKVNSKNSLRRTALDISIDCMCERCRATTEVLLVEGGKLNSPEDKGKKNHPELFDDSRQPLPEWVDTASSTVLSSDDGSSFSPALQPSTGFDGSSMADTRSTSLFDEMEDGESVIDIKSADSAVKDADTGGGETVEGKRARFKKFLKRHVS